MDKLFDIFCRKLDSYVNPKIENRVIYGLLFSGVSLVVGPKLLNLVQAFRFKSEQFEIEINSGEFEETFVFLGIALVLISALLLYLFKFHKRPELILHSESSSAHRWEQQKYSFQNEEYINPFIVKDLIGWLSDTKRQIVSIDISGSNNSNRYYAEVTHRTVENRTFIEAKHEDVKFGYEYLGTSESGIHALRTFDSGGGSGVFQWLTLVVIEENTFVVRENEMPEMQTTAVIRLVGNIGLGDRYQGDIIFSRGTIKIQKDSSHLPDHVIDKSKTIIIK